MRNSHPDGCIQFSLQPDTVSTLVEQPALELNRPRTLSKSRPFDSIHTRT
jgi:hypothetical protein